MRLLRGALRERFTASLASKPKPKPKRRPEPNPTGDPEVFAEALEEFRALIPLTDEEFESILLEEEALAFRVAGVTQSDVVQYVFDRLDDAIEKGTTLEDFRADTLDVLESEWGGSVANPGARVETIFRTNTMRAYNAGRWRQLTDEDVADDRPYLHLVGVKDAKTCSRCESVIGTILPADHAFWRSHVPPLHHNCRSTIVALTPEEAQELGVTKKAPPRASDPGFGAPPDDNEGDAAPEWEPDPTAYDPGIRDEVKRRLAERAGGELFKSIKRKRDT